MLQKAATWEYLWQHVFFSGGAAAEEPRKESQLGGETAEGGWGGEGWRR